MSQSFNVFKVDDDPVVLDGMHAVLEPDCQMLMAQEAPDLVLRDIGLPGVDGYGLGRQIKDDSRRRGILLQRYPLDGVGRTRREGRSLTLGAAISNLPLEIAVIEHVRQQGRIVERRDFCGEATRRQTIWTMPAFR